MMLMAQLVQSYAKWGHKPHPVIPEPATYGVIFLALAAIFVLLRTAKR